MLDFLKVDDVIPSYKIKESWLIKNSPSVLTFINTQIPENINISFKIWLIQNNFISPFECVVCGKKHRVISNTNKQKSEWKRSDYCSNECYKNDPNRSQKTKNSLRRVNVTEANKKREDTCLSKYGVRFAKQRPDKPKESKIQKSNPVAFRKLSDKDWLETEYVVNKRTSVDIAKELNVFYGTVIRYCRDYGFEIRQHSNYSLMEVELKGYIESLGVSVIHGDRKVLDGQEIDILIPSTKIGIELNGVRWHSVSRNEETPDAKQYHLNKTRVAKDKGIELIHITDIQWQTKQDIVKSFIKSKLGLNKRVFARNTTFIDPSAQEAKEFQNENHLQGWVPSSIKIGLADDEGQLIALATFGKSRYSTIAKYELLRLCFKSGITVVGGFSKILKAFKKTVSQSLMTYADRSISTGNVYHKTGKLVKTTPPGYSWVKHDVVYNRTHFQKHKLVDKLEIFDNALSEADNMFNNGYRRLWDCGQLVFLL